MSQYVALSPSRHQGQGWLKFVDYGFAATQSLAPLVAEELPHALATLPIGFAQRADGSFELVAVLSLEAGRNLFVHPDGRWVGGYKPAQFRSYPFRLLPDADNGRHLVCIDEQSGLLVEDASREGEPFFTAEGEPAELLSKVIDFLKQWERQRRITQRAVDMLAGQSLIVPWEIQVSASSDHTQPLEGLYRVDERALNALSSGGMAALREVNALPVAYAQLFSQHRISVLSRLYQLQSRFRQADSEPADIESLFDSANDDLSLDFDS